MKFAILGTARIARRLAPGIQGSDRAELVGIASRQLENAKAFADEFSIPQTYDGYQAALDDPQIDAVYLPLPPSLHLEWTQKAAAAGKHVLCEKPLARNADEVRQMIAACQKNHVVLLDGVMWYHTPRSQQMLDIVYSGELGRLRQVNAVFTFCWDEFPMNDLRMHREMGGGSLLDLGWYTVGGCLQAFQSMPEKVFASARFHNDVDVRLNGMMWFSDERVATIECSFDTLRRRWIEVAGSKRNLVCDDFTRPWNEEKPRFWTHDADGKASENVVPHRPQEECMVESFCELVERKAVDHPLLQLALNTQIVCDALDESARTGRAVDLPTQ